MPKINPEVSAAIEAQKAAQAARLTSLGLDPNKPPRDVSPIRKNISLEPFHTWRKASGLPLPQTPEANDEMWARYRYETGKTPPVGFGKNPVEMRGWSYDPNSSTNIYKQPPMTPTPISDDIKNWYKENMPDYYKDQFDPGYNPPNRGYGTAPTGNQPQPSTYTPPSIYNPTPVGPNGGMSPNLGPYGGLPQPPGLPGVGPQQNPAGGTSSWYSGSNPEGSGFTGTALPLDANGMPITPGPDMSGATPLNLPPQVTGPPAGYDRSAMKRQDVNYGGDLVGPQMGTVAGGGYRGATPYKRGRRSTLPTVLP